MAKPKFQIRAHHTDSTITVYQAYSPAIGLPAARENRFPALWRRDRMTWIFSAPTRASEGRRSVTAPDQ
ncbi:DUF4291 family protein [Streptomyces sp. NPDC002386]